MIVMMMITATDTLHYTVLVSVVSIPWNSWTWRYCPYNLHSICHRFIMFRFEL